MTESGEAEWIDVSVTVRHGMPHWPGNPPIVMQRAMDIGRGDGCNLSHLAMGVHSGTHVCLPVKLHDSDGAPARAILRPVPRRPPEPATSGDRA